MTMLPQQHVLFGSTLFFKDLNTFLVLIFVMFVADDPHFNIMFKMVIILTKYLKWSLFSQFMFYLVLFCNAV